MKNRLKNLVKAVLALNTYGNACFYRFIGKKNRKILEKRIAETATADYLESTDSLREFRARIARGEEVFYTTDANWSNGHIYGIWQALFGEYSAEKASALPSVEHGLIFHEDVFTDLRGTARPAFVSFSPFRKEIIQRKLQRPVFCVGPYIHYCKEFYSETQRKEWKEKLGKTLLVFPAHSTDTSLLSIDQQRYLANLREAAKAYDTVLVNVFWWNINDAFTQALAREGYRIISCGFRDDPQFLPRLKSYILLADFAIGDSIGTHVGYCLDCGVPFAYQNSGTQVQLLKEEERKDGDFRTLHIGKLEAAFLNSQGITSQQRELCDYYWGSSRCKSAEELQWIQEISRELQAETKGFTFLSSVASKRLLSRYRQVNEKKYQLLKEAL